MIGGSHVLNNAQWLDPVGGLVISLMVVQAGFGNTKDALLELADVGIDEEIKENVEKTTRRALDTLNTNSKEAVEFRQVQGVKAGQNYLIDIELAVPTTWTLDKTGAVEDLVRERLGAKVRGVKRVRVRFVSKESGPPNFMDEFISSEISPSSSPEPEEDHDHMNSHTHINGNGDARRRR